MKFVVTEYLIGIIRAIIYSEIQTVTSTGNTLKTTKFGYLSLIGRF